MNHEKIRKAFKAIENAPSGSSKLREAMVYVDLHAPQWLHQLLEENKQLSDELHWWQLERDRTNTQLNTAIEALELIKHKGIGDVYNIAFKTLKQLKGEESNAGT